MSSSTGAAGVSAVSGENPNPESLRADDEVGSSPARTIVTTAAARAPASSLIR